MKCTLRTTVSDDVKRQFVARCRELRLSKSEVLRYLIHLFLTDASLFTTATAESADLTNDHPILEPWDFMSEEKQIQQELHSLPEKMDSSVPPLKTWHLTIFGREYILKAI